MKLHYSYPNTTLPGRPRRLALAVMLASLPASLAAQQSDTPDVEEVVVTGSYIRGTPLDAPSPVQVIDRDSIEAQGASQIWDVIRNLEANSGSDTDVSGSNDASQLTGTAQVNLRNLGGNATLTLINGKRQVPAAAVSSSGGEFVDLNSIPLVMTQRVEVLTDGGSALYGSDAVAGVVNVIMRNDFEGLELYGDVQGIAKAGDLFDTTVSGIWGWADDSGDTHFVLSAEHFDRDRVPVRYANSYQPEFATYNGTVGAMSNSLVLPGATTNPAYVRQDLIDRNIEEDNNSDTVLQDPLCYEQTDVDGNPFYSDNRYSDLGENHADCQEDTSEWSSVALATQRTSFAGSFNHSFNEAAEFYSFFQYSDAETERDNTSRISSRSVHLYLAPPGAHGGNPFGSQVELGHFAPEIGLSRPTEADIPNSPLSTANGGIGTAMQGTGVAVGWPRTANSDYTYNETMGVQAGLRGEFYAADRRFDYDVSYSWSGSSIEQNYRTLNRQNTELALQGLGGPECTPNGVADFDYAGASPFIWSSGGAGLADIFTQQTFPGYTLNLHETLSLGLTSNNQGQGGCQFFNPFLTALADPELANSPELIDWMVEDVKRADKRNKLAVFDAVVSGELFEMAGGTAQFAAGGQYRQRNAKSNAPAINLPGIPDAIRGYDENGVPNEFAYVTNNLECAQCIFNFDHDRDVKAVFGELSLPLWNNVESQVALRWEDYGGNIGSELTPKLAISWRPVDTLMLRGSYSQSFRAPNIGVVEESFDAFAAGFQDPLREQEVRAGLLPPTNENARSNFSYTVGAPNPDLGNESADTYSMGFQWTPGGQLEGFNLGADFWRFEVKDRVLPQIPVTALFPERDAFIAASQDPSNYVSNESLPSDADERFVSCDPDALESQFGRDSDERLDCVVDPRTYEVDGVVRVPGSTTAAISQITLKAINGGNIEVDGVDMTAGYDWTHDWGQFSLGMSFTHVRQYAVNDIPGYDLGLQETGRFDAAGTDGDTPIVRSLPDNKGSITLGWNNGNHSASVINRHIGSFEILGYQNSFDNASERTRDFLRPETSHYQTWDFQYNYSHDWANDAFGTTRFTVGILDAFNADLPYTSLDNYDTSVYDGRGRRYYFRALMQF